MLSDEQFTESLRAALRTGQRDPAPDLLERIHSELERGPLRRRLSVPGGLRPTGGGILVACSVIATLAIGVLAVALLGHSRPPAGRVAGRSLRAIPHRGTTEQRLLSEYAVLRRSQTEADRAEAGAPPSLNHAGGGGGGGTRNGGYHSYTDQILGLAPFTNVPGLTRVVTVDGVTVSLFVEHVTPSDAMPRVVVHAHPSTYRPSGAITHSGLEFYRRSRNSFAGYSLWVRVHGGTFEGPARAQFVGPLNRPATAGTASIEGPGSTIVAVVPDRVIHVRWAWPAQFDTSSLKHDPPLTVNTTVRDNIATGRADRFLSPASVTWLGASGRILLTASDPNGAAGSANEYTTDDSSVPTPPTPRSRRAERDPATANPVVVQPDVTAPGSGVQFFFHVLLNHRTYYARITGGPHPGCITGVPASNGPSRTGEVLHPGAEMTVRGDTYEDTTGPEVAQCPGKYRLSIAVLGPHGPYAPFGTDAFTVR